MRSITKYSLALIVRKLSYSACQRIILCNWKMLYMSFERILNLRKHSDFHLGVFLQTSGEAQYVSDIPIQGGELYAAFVVSTQV